MARSGFTLVEALVVAAILILIASLAFPAALRAKAAAKQSHCIQNLHQLDTALRLYGADWDDLHTRPPSFSPILYPYAKSAEVFRCPADATDRRRPANAPAPGTYADNLYDTDESGPRAAFQVSSYFRGYGLKHLPPDHEQWRIAMRLEKLGIIVCPFHAERDRSGGTHPYNDHMGPRTGPCLRIVPSGALLVAQARSRNDRGSNVFNHTCFNAPHTAKEMHGMGGS